MSEKIEKRLFFISAIFLLIGLFFCIGFAVAKFRLPPYETIRIVYGHFRSLLKFDVAAPDNLIFPIPRDSSRKRLYIKSPELMEDGFYAFLGYDSQNTAYRAWLFDSHGREVHSWQIKYSSFTTNQPLNGSDTPHGFKVQRDGSVIVNFDKGNILGKLNSCSQRVWSREGVFHHSLQETDDGSFWTWRGEGSAYSQYQFLVNFDPVTGKTIQEISLVDDLIRPKGDAETVFMVRPDFPFERFHKDPHDAKDIFHPNDIDVLSSKLAPLFPAFTTGDLLISLKKLNLVAVVDPKDKTVKWASHGPWRWQHDPDFAPDGTISVFNNNIGHHRSEILSIDPTHRRVRNVLINSDLHFYSGHMGKHQYLPNGNILIVVPEEGRILVMSKQGKKILEFNNLLINSNDHSAHVENAEWLPSDYFKSIPSCPHG